MARAACAKALEKNTSHQFGLEKITDAWILFFQLQAQ